MVMLRVALPPTQFVVQGVFGEPLHESKVVDSKSTAAKTIRKFIEPPNVPGTILSPAYQELLAKGELMFNRSMRPPGFHSTKSWVRLVSWLCHSLCYLWRYNTCAFGRVEDIDFWQNVKQQR
jgi:hypothetical protein